MIAKDLIKDNIITLKTSDSCSFVIEKMEEFKVNHLPIVNNKDFLGLVSDLDIYSEKELNKALGNCYLSLINPYVYSNQHIFEVIKIVTRLKLTVIPVLNLNNEYIGSINLLDLVNAVSEILSCDTKGAIIVLEMNMCDYSCSQITQLIESENCKILNLYLKPKKSSTLVNLSVKINITDTTKVVKSLERHNYQIISSYSYTNSEESALTEKLDEFLNYLNI